MTKRAFPFESHLSRQYKIHVSLYQNDLNALKEIEENTMRKLMNASKNIKSNNQYDSNGFHDESMSHQVENFKNNKNMRQKCVTNYFTINGQIINETSNTISSPSIINKCFFCDHKTDSIYQCTNCGENYCTTCSFINYESSENNRICLSCS